MKMAGPFAPPILSFAKRENAPCTVEERKRGRGCGTDCLLRKSLPAAWCGRGFWRLMQGLISRPRCR